MTIRTPLLVTSIAVLAATTQWPAPSSQPPTAPPAAEQPVQSADGGPVVTFTGCVSPADPGGATAAGRIPGFVLTDVTDAGAKQASDASGVAEATSTSTTGTVTDSRPAERYLLTAKDTGLDLSAHAGRRVKVTGTVNERVSQGAGARDDSRGAPTSSQPGGAGAQHALSTLTVHSISPADGSCK